MILNSWNTIQVIYRICDVAINTQEIPFTTPRQPAQVWGLLKLRSLNSPLAKFLLLQKHVL